MRLLIKPWCRLESGSQQELRLWPVASPRVRSRLAGPILACLTAALLLLSTPAQTQTPSLVGKWRWSSDTLKNGGKFAITRQSKDGVFDGQFENPPIPLWGQVENNMALFHVRGPYGMMHFAATKLQSAPGSEEIHLMVMGGDIHVDNGRSAEFIAEKIH